MATSGGSNQAEALEDGKCLSDKSEKQVYQILYFLYEGELVDIGTVLTDASELFTDTFLHCAVLETTSDIYNKCKTQQSCSLSEVISNIVTHKALLAKLAENFVDLVVSRRVWETVKTPGDLFDVMQTIGEDVGELIVDTFKLI